MESKFKHLTPKSFTQWISGACLLTLMQTGNKVARKCGFHHVHTMLSRYIIGFLMVLAVAVGRKFPCAVYKTNAFWLQSARALSMVITTLGLFYGNDYLGVGLGTALHYPWPAMGIAIGWFKFFKSGTKPDLRSVLSAGLMTFGALALGGSRVGDAPITHDMLKGFIAIFCAVTAYGFYVNLTPMCSAKDTDPTTGMFYLMGLGSVFLVIFLVLMSFFVRLPVMPSITFLGVTAILEIPVTGTLAMLFYQLAQRLSPTNKLVPLTPMFQLPFAVVVGHYAFQEAWPSLTEIAYMFVIFFGGFVNYMDMPSKGPPSAPEVDAA